MHNEKNIAIIGCGRSGTKYIAKVISCAGLDVRHEKKGENGYASWFATSPFVKHKTDTIILHQIREPIPVINSFRIANEPSWDWIYANVHQIHKGISHIKRCMLYWLYWNLLAESQSEWSYRVETLFNADVFDEFCSRLKITPTEEQIQQMKFVPTTTNSKDHHRKYKEKGMDKVLEWGDLMEEDAELFDKIITQSKRYGYA